MATVLSFTTAKQMLIAALQASQTPNASTVDGSNAQYNSDTLLANYILDADFECATLIAKTPLHPYQTQFVAAPASLVSGSNSPIRNGMILRVTGQVGSAATYSFTSGQISTTTDLVTVADHGLVTGQAVQLTNLSGLPPPLVFSTTYYISVVSSSTYGFSTTLYNAKSGTLINISGQGTGTNTVTTQYIDIQKADAKETITQMANQSYMFASQQGVTAGWWFEELDTFYTTCPNAKMYYTDTTLTSTPQCPEPYLFAVVAGAIAKAAQDGGDAGLAQYYFAQYQGYMQEIGSNAKALPEIASYAGGMSV